MSRPAVFFDRDDTLMVNVPYLGDPAQVEAFAEAAPALAQLRDAGYLLYVVSNQSGVGRGLITREQVHAVNIELHRQMGSEYVHAFYHSFATPDDPYATDRKPSPELVLTAAREHDIDLAQSFFVGDRLTDIECGLAAGCRTILLNHAKSSRAEADEEEDVVARRKAQFRAKDLHQAVDFILGRKPATGDATPVS
jgi:D-glycero-D-manno-heptose 1,7-bisphosphate phosphatase